MVNIQIGVTGDNEIDTSPATWTIHSTGGTTQSTTTQVLVVHLKLLVVTVHLLDICCPSADVTYDLGAQAQLDGVIYIQVVLVLNLAAQLLQQVVVQLFQDSTIAGAGTIFDTTTRDTDDLSEGSTTYYTDTRVQTYIGGGTATNISNRGNLNS